MSAGSEDMIRLVLIMSLRLTRCATCYATGYRGSGG